MSKIDYLKKWGKRVDSAINQAYILTGAALLMNTASIPVTAYINSNIENKNKTAVFTSGYYNTSNSNKAVAKFIDFFMYTPITLRQNLRGNHVDWYSNSTKDQILQNIQSPDYKNIIFIGHGNNASYGATDGIVTVDDLVKINLPQRNGGEYIQHTCGGGNFEKNLRQVLYPEKSEGYSFDREVSFHENYRRSLTECLTELLYNKPKSFF